MVYRGVCLDLDGTTLNSEHNLSTFTEETLRDLNQRGLIITIVTGRATGSVHRIVSQLNLNQETTYTVCYNGSAGYSVRKSESGTFAEPTKLFEACLEKSTSQTLLDFAAEFGLVSQYYNSTTGEIFAHPTAPEHFEFLTKYELLVSHKQVFCEYDVAIQKSAAAKILIMTPDADEFIRNIIERFPSPTDKTKYDDSLFHMIKGSPNPFFVEFLPPNVHKGSGFVHLCKLLDVDPAVMIAFGDGENDKEMLAAAGLGVAMKNASEPAKRSSNIVLEWTNDENGVAKQLLKMADEGLLILAPK